MESIEPKKTNLAEALKGLEKAMNLSPQTASIEKVSLEESERIRGNEAVRSSKPKTKQTPLERRYPGAEGFARRNPDN